MPERTTDIAAVWRACGDTALLLDYNGFTPSWTPHVSSVQDKSQLMARVRQLSIRIQHLRDRGDLKGIHDVVPGLGSVLIHYNPLTTSADTIKRELTPIIGRKDNVTLKKTRHWHLPVCYDEEFGPDLAEIADSCALSTDKILSLHQHACFDVAIMGFLPGLGYMTGLPEQLYMPRRANPRTDVAKGSVGIAMDQCVIYPLDSPGGWNLIGRMPIPLFDSQREQPLLFHPGDSVSFYAINRTEYTDLARSCDAGQLPISPRLTSENYQNP